MTAPLLLLFALAAAVLVQAFIRSVLAPRRRWAAAGRPRLAMARRRAMSRRGAMARRIVIPGQIDPREPRADIGGWENEGGAVAHSRGPDVPSRTRPAAPKAA